MLDTPTVVAVVFGTIFVVMAGLTAYILYTCRRREQLNQDEEQNLRQQTYQSRSSHEAGNPLLALHTGLWCMVWYPGRLSICSK
jgi:hypothetical protein